MDEKFLKVYEHLLKMQELVLEAKNQLTLGTSPYTTLTQINYVSQLARTAWHKVELNVNET